MGGVIIFFVAVDDVGVSQENEGDGAAGRTGIDRLPEPVQNKDM
jgi:hypothetical protein